MQFNSIVIDNGSDITKAGFSGFLIPDLVVPTIIGYPKYDKYIKTDIKDYKYHIGHVAQNKKSILNIHNPIKNGIIDNWDHMTKIWEYIFDRLGTESNNKKSVVNRTYS
jgi:actin-related protein